MVLSLTVVDSWIEHQDEGNEDPATARATPLKRAHQCKHYVHMEHAGAKFGPHREEGARSQTMTGQPA